MTTQERESLYAVWEQARDYQNFRRGVHAAQRLGELHGLTGEEMEAIYKNMISAYVSEVIRQQAEEILLGKVVHRFEVALERYL